MNWIKQNPFIAGLLGVTVVLLGVFGFLLFQEHSAYAEVSEKFVTKSAEAATLQAKKPYPDKGNLQKATAEKDRYKAKVEELQKQLIAFNLPLTPISVVEFVAKLREWNSKVVEAAQQDGVKLPEKFYMGFEKYETSPPTEKAVSRLNQQLEAIDTVLKILVQQHIFELKTLKRDEIPEEAAPPKDSATGLVTKTSFLIEFRTDQEKLRSILNKIAAMEKPFLVIRNLRIVNDVVDTIPRTPAQPAGAPAAPPPDAAPDPNNPNPLPENPPAPPSAITTISGTEKVTVSLEIEVITFGEGQAQPAAGAPKAPDGGGRQKRSDAPR